MSAIVFGNGYKHKMDLQMNRGMFSSGTRVQGTRTDGPTHVEGAVHTERVGVGTGSSRCVRGRREYVLGYVRGART